jgi:hypothetical protein
MIHPGAATGERDVMKQMPFSAAGFERYGETTRRAAFLAGMERVVPWRDPCMLIEPVYPKPGDGRRQIGLERHDLGRKLFEQGPRHLEAHGLKVATGTIVDATIINAPSSTQNAAGRARRRCVRPGRASRGISG